MNQNEVFMTGRGRESRQTEGRAPRRRNRRERLRFPVTVEVPLDDGRTRVVSAQTVVVSHAGATLEVDETILVGMGVQVTPPFGGALLAEVNGAWVEEGRHRVSIRLIDPASWTSPDRLSVPAAAAAKTMSLRIQPRLWQMLVEYTEYMSDTRGGRPTVGDAAESILERAFLNDEKFQDWFAAKIMEDLQAWQAANCLTT